MFKLVGTETVTIGKSDANCLIKIEPYGGFSYQYSLDVNGKTYKTFTEQQAKVRTQKHFHYLKNCFIFLKFHSI